MKYLIAICFSLATFLGQSQALLVPGAGSFEAKWLKNDINRMEWFMFRDTARVKIGEIVTETSLNEKNITVVTKVEITNARTSWVDTTIADRYTLNPIRHSSYNAQREMVLDFGRKITGYYTNLTNNSSNRITDSTEQGYFDSNIYPALVSWLPLKDGYQQEIAIYDYNPAAKSGVLKANVKSVKSGKYKTKAGVEREVWITTVSDEIGNGGNGTSTYYFDKQTRKLWKQEIEAGGRKMLIEAKQ